MVQKLESLIEKRRKYTQEIPTKKLCKDRASRKREDPLQRNITPAHKNAAESGAEVCQIHCQCCRSKILAAQKLLAKIGVDTAENKLPKDPYILPSIRRALGAESIGANASVSAARSITVSNLLVLFWPPVNCEYVRLTATRK